MLKTLGYKSEMVQDVEIGNVYFFGELWDGDGEGEELLESGSIAMVDEDGEDIIVDFELVGEAEYYIADTLVQVTGL